MKGKHKEFISATIITAEVGVKKYEEKPVPLPTYIKQKVKIMHDFGYRYITENFFRGCANEIQVDQKAHTVLLG